MERKINKRCAWVNLENPLSVEYHDNEWGVPEHDDKKLFEMLLLECFQAGLSWECILNKREAFRRAFDGFDAEKISRYGERKCDELMSDAGIVRNRLKIKAAIANSRAFLQIQKEFGSFDAYVWSFTGGRSIPEPCNLRATSPLSDRMSEELKKRGMKFVGSTIVYAFLQAVGVIQPHTEDCDCRPVATEQADAERL